MWVCAADFPSAPDLTAAAAAQNLEWAPILVQDASVVSYNLRYNAAAAAARLTMTVTATVGVAGSITDLAAASSSSGRRTLLSSGTCACLLRLPFVWLA